MDWKWFDETGGTIVCAGAFADIQIGNLHPHKIRGYGGPCGAACGLFCGWWCNYYPATIGSALKPSVDFCGNLPVSGIKIFPRTGFVGEVTMNGHIASVPMVHTVILVRTPYQLLDPVPLANIRYQIQQGRISLGGDGVRVGGVGSNFNGDCPVVIGAVAGTPRTILFIHGKANGTILTNNIVGGTLPVCGGEIITPLFCCPLPNDTMNRDGVNGMVPGAGFVFRDPGIGCKAGITHFLYLLSPEEWL